MASPRMQVDGRIAWLLMTSRILGPDPDLARRSVLISRLLDRGIDVDAPRLSRLESGGIPVPNATLVGYEQVLGLTPGLLSATVSGVRRAFNAGVGTRERKPTDANTDADLDQLLGLVAADAATGVDWLRAALTLSRFERVFLRQDDWTALCGTLIRELGTSTGIDYVRRFEAATTLLHHPSARRHVSLAIGNFVMDPDTQVTSPVLNLLAEVADPAASELTLRLLDSPVKSLRRGAACVAAHKLARGHFDVASLPILERHVESRLSRGMSLDGSLDALDLAVQLPETSWTNVERRLRDPIATAIVARSRSTRELLQPRKAAALAAEVGAAIQAATPTHLPLETDMMLHRLVREALVHVHKARRHQAALLLAASPYAPAAATQISKLTHHRDDLIAARAWTVLMRLPDPAHRGEQSEQDVPDVTEAHLARALINVGLHDRQLSKDALDHLASRLPTRRPSQQHAILFALGMQGAPELERLIEHEDNGVRRQAAWWLLQGGATRDHDSVAQRGSSAS